MIYSEEENNETIAQAKSLIRTINLHPDGGRAYDDAFDKIHGLTLLSNGTYFEDEPADDLAEAIFMLTIRELGPQSFKQYCDRFPLLLNKFSTFSRPPEWIRRQSVGNVIASILSVTGSINHIPDNFYESLPEIDQDIVSRYVIMESIDSNNETNRELAIIESNLKTFKQNGCLIPRDQIFQDLVSAIECTSEQDPQELHTDLESFKLIITKLFEIQKNITNVQNLIKRDIEDRTFTVGGVTHIVDEITSEISYFGSDTQMRDDGHIPHIKYFGIDVALDYELAQRLARYDRNTWKIYLYDANLHENSDINSTIARFIGKMSIFERYCHPNSLVKSELSANTLPENELQTLLVNPNSYVTDAEKSISNHLFIEDLNLSIPDDVLNNWLKDYRFSRRVAKQVMHEALWAIYLSNK